jgi:hypothetical protein
VFCDGSVPEGLEGGTIVSAGFTLVSLLIIAVSRSTVFSAGLRAASESIITCDVMLDTKVEARTGLIVRADERSEGA